MVSNNAKKKLRIVYMGTPDFSVESLRTIYQSEHKVAAVVTAPDRAAGRGQKIRFSPVKEYAVKHNITVLQPANLKSNDFLQLLKSFDADVFVVVAFRMLPKEVWQMPSLGTINLHASLLPQYRGAAPINHAIINGETITGLTTFYIQEQIDTGNIIKQQEVLISALDNAGTLHDKMMHIGADLLLETLNHLQEDRRGEPQVNLITENINLKFAPKIYKENCKINWTDTGENIYNFIRGLSPYPTAWTKFYNKKNHKSFLVKIFSSRFIHKSDIIENEIQNLNIGTVLIKNDNIFIVVTNGYIMIEELQKESRKKIKADEFLKGLANKTDLIVK